MKPKWILVTAFAVASTLSACGGGGGAGGGAAETSRVKVKLAGNFGLQDQGSVKITGARQTDSQNLYQCDNAILTGDQCHNLSGTGATTVSLGNLCPSDDYPQDAWDFSYAIYSGSNCTGTLINDALNSFNLACFDSTDIVSQAHPNQTANKWLNPGTANSSSVVCITENSTNGWSFNSCVRIADVDLRLDCGCQWSTDHCDCTSVGLDPTTLTPGCTLENNTCNVVCVTS